MSGLNPRTRAEAEALYQRCENFVSRLVIHESVQPNVLFAVGPCTCKGERKDCPRCNGLGIFVVKAKVEPE